MTAKRKLIIYDTSIVYCDGGMNKHTGDEAWGSVVDKNSRCLIKLFRERLKEDLKVDIKKVNLPVGVRYIVVSKFNDVKSQQNNGAELLAMLIALKIIRYTNQESKTTIKCDSKLIIESWSFGRVGHKTKQTMDPLKYQYIEECAKLRKDYDKKGGKIEKIEGKYNEADLGYHK